MFEWLGGVLDAWLNIFLQPSPWGTVYLGLLFQGLAITFFVALVTWAIAFVLGSLIGIARTLPYKPLRFVTTAYVEIFRSVPLLVQLFLWFFVVPELLPQAWGTWIKNLESGSMLTAIIGLGCFTSVRIAEQVRAAILSISLGMKNASTALGMTRAQTYRYILLPMGYRIMLPPLTSEFLNNLKNTSTIFTIGVMDLMGRTSEMMEFTFKAYEPLFFATFCYLIINLLVVCAARFLEGMAAIPGFNAAR
ncbi:MAG: amino acid ABC transporter permease [Methylobacteriaceae bacterium]|jgi:glutamate/aspartate transport system permease protein|nr:amino acid ABC transporter permease [Methylobacteriaceae bacterium]